MLSGLRHWRVSSPVRRAALQWFRGLLVLLLMSGAWPDVDGATSSTAGTPSSSEATISPWIRQQTAEGARTDVLVVLKEQADLEPAFAMPGNGERGHWVYRTLWQTAERSQAPLQAWLGARGASYRSFYIVNVVLVEDADWTLVQALAARPEVARIEANPTMRGTKSDRETRALSSLSSEGTEWNILRVNADDMWAMGYTGQGIVIGGQDTGYDWAHPALEGQYREPQPGYGRHDYNWHDAIHENNPNTVDGNPCGFDSAEPCDDHGHGTHTMGIAVGDDGGVHQIGVAPGARWIGCRNMEQGWGTPDSYLECFEFFLAPYPVGEGPNAGEPDLAPDVTNNSWTCPPEEGCPWEILESAVEAQRAAGILTVAAAGNDGYLGCLSVSTPPAIYDDAYTIGATDKLDNLAGYSSRGPVKVDGSKRLKPDLVAPGSGILSSVPGGLYGISSGTSMAAPHVAGAAALLWSAIPGLAGDLPTTEAQLNNNAYVIPSTECSSEGVPNNLYGWGRLDVSAAACDIVGSFQIQPSPVVAGEPFTLTAAVTAGIVPITFAWNLGDETDLQVGNPISHTYTRPGTYGVELTLSNVCPESSVVTGTIGVRGGVLRFLPLVMRASEP